MHSARADRFGWIGIGTGVLWLLMWTRHDAPDVHWLAERFGSWGLLAAAAVYLFHILVHELGHAICGTLVGFRIDAINVSVLQFARDPDGGWLLVDLRHGGSWVSGYVRADARTLSRLPLRLGLMVAGGPLATLALGIACVVIAVRVQPAPGLAIYGAAIAAWVMVELTRFHGEHYLSDAQLLRGCVRREEALLKSYRLGALCRALWRGEPLAATNVLRGELDELATWDPTQWARVCGCVEAIQAGDFARSLELARGRDHQPAMLPAAPGQVARGRDHHAMALLGQLEIALLARLQRAGEARPRFDSMLAAHVTLYGTALSPTVGDVAAAVLFSEGKKDEALVAWAEYEKWLGAQPREQALINHAVTGWVHEWIS